MLSLYRYVVSRHEFVVAKNSLVEWGPQKANKEAVCVQAPRTWNVPGAAPELSKDGLIISDGSGNIRSPIECSRIRGSTSGVIFLAISGTGVDSC